MTSKSFDEALDFLPNAVASNIPRTGRLWAGVQSFFVAIRDGLEAQHQYKLRTSRGIPSALAAKAAFDTIAK